MEEWKVQKYHLLSHALCHIRTILCFKMCTGRRVLSGTGSGMGSSAPLDALDAHPVLSSSRYGIDPTRPVLADGPICLQQQRQLLQPKRSLQFWLMVTVMMVATSVMTKRISAEAKVNVTIASLPLAGCLTSWLLCKPFTVCIHPAVLLRLYSSSLERPYKRWARGEMVVVTIVATSLLPVFTTRPPLT